MSSSLFPDHDCAFSCNFIELDYVKPWKLPSWKCLDKSDVHTLSKHKYKKGLWSFHTVWVILTLRTKWTIWHPFCRSLRSEVLAAIIWQKPPLPISWSYHWSACCSWPLRAALILMASGFLSPVLRLWSVVCACPCRNVPAPGFCLSLFPKLVTVLLMCLPVAHSWHRPIWTSWSRCCFSILTGRDTCCKSSHFCNASLFEYLPENRMDEYELLLLHSS